MVILAGSDDEEIAVVALREGAQECVPKDRVDASVLAAAVRHSLERHGYNETLRTTESRYRSLVEGTVQGILIHANGIVRFANRSMCQLVGADRPEELIGRTIWQFVYPEDRLKVMEDALA